MAGALALCAATIAVPAAPALADTAPRLVKATVVATPVGGGTAVVLTMRTVGDIARIDYEYDVAAGTLPTIRFTGSVALPAAQVVKSDALQSYAPAGDYSLTVTLVGNDGSTTRYLPDGTARSCRVDHVCAIAATGLTVMNGTGFNRPFGPSSASALVAASGRITAGSLTTPASGGSIAAGATIASTLTYAAATVGAAPVGTTIFPVYSGDSQAAYVVGPSVSATGATGTAVPTGAAPTSGFAWGLFAYVARTGMIDRVVADHDRAYIHTTWPLAAVNAANMPPACGLVNGLHPSTDCAVLVDNGVLSFTGGSFFITSGSTHDWSAPWWLTELSGGSVDTSAVVSNASHPISFIVHYRGMANPIGQTVSATVSGPGAAGLSSTGHAGACAKDPIDTSFYKCDIAISVFGVQYNGTYAATSLKLDFVDAPSITCAPGPTARLTGVGLDDPLTGQTARIAQMCGSITWTALKAVVTGRNPAPCTDSSAPVLTAFSRTSATAFDGTSSPTTGKATFHWAATDAGCGLTRIAATFIRADGVTWVANLNMSARASGSGAVDLTPAVGSWGVRDVAVYDAAGNVRHYDPSGVAAAVLAGAPTPYQRTPHSLDLGAAGVLANAGAPPAGVPAPPRALKVTPGGTSLAVSWAAPAPATGVTSYQVTVRSAVDGTSATHAVTASTTHLTVTGLDPATPYQVSVVALAGARVSPWTPLSRTITPATQPVLEPPAAAPTLAAFPVPLLSSTLPLSVTPQVVPGYPVTSYQVQWRYSGASAVFPASWADKGAPTASPPTSITGLPAGAKVCVRVVPVNRAGRGPASNTRCTAVPLDERALTASTGWTRAATIGAYGSTTSTSSTRGATLSLAAARGNGLVVLVRTRAGGGTLGVYVGTRRVATISTVGTSRTVAFRYGSTVTGSLTGQKITLKVETAGSPVTVDGLAVLP